MATEQGDVAMSHETGDPGESAHGTTAAVAKSKPKPKTKARTKKTPVAEPTSIPKSVLGKRTAEAQAGSKKHKAPSIFVTHVTGLPKDTAAPFVSSALVCHPDDETALEILATQYYGSPGALQDDAVREQVSVWFNGGMTVDVTQPHFYNVTYGSPSVRSLANSNAMRDASADPQDARRLANKRGQNLWVCRDFPDNGGAAAVAFVVAAAEQDVVKMVQAYIQSSVDDEDQRDPAYIQENGELGSMEQVNIKDTPFILLSDGSPSAAL